MNRSLLPFPCCSAHTANPWDTPFPALCRERAGSDDVLLDQRPSLLTLRRRSPAFVRLIHRYYSAVRLLEGVACGPYGSWPSPAGPVAKVRFRHLRGLPVLVHGVSRRAWGLRLRRADQPLATNAAARVAFRYLDRVGALICRFSKLDTQPTYSPVYASLDTSRRRPQDSRPGWSRFLLSCRALSFPTTCRLFRKHYSCSPSGVSGAAMIWTWMPRRRRHRR